MFHQEPSSGYRSCQIQRYPPSARVPPAFTLPAVPDGKVRLSQFKGKQNVVLYFYPRDNTPGCTTEACDFRDHGSTAGHGHRRARREHRQHRFA
ncbi:MAG: redoxin domain-containing protein [Planctomycetaceae bacterium]